MGYFTTDRFTGFEGMSLLAWDTSLYSIICIGVCLIAWRIKLAWRCLMLGMFILLPAVCHSGFDLPCEIGLFCWAILCLVENGKSLILKLLALAAFAVALSFSKMTFLVLAGITLSTVAADLWFRGRRRLTIGLLLTFLLGSLGVWANLGQNLTNLGAYFKNGMAITSGYEQAMGVKQSASLWVAIIVLTLLAISAAAIRSAKANLPGSLNLFWRRGLLFGWILGFIFIAWKHGAVRSNCDLAAAVILIVVLGLESIPVSFPRTGQWTRFLGLASCICALLVVGWKRPDYFDNYPATAVKQFTFNGKTLLCPFNYFLDMAAKLQTQSELSQLPKIQKIVGHSSVDVFGFFQGYAIFNNLNYHPRPVFQGYTVYNADLMHLNEDFYESKAAPEYVLFNLHSIDGRYPPLDDAYLFRDLLFNYVPVETEKPFLLLKKQYSNLPKMTLLRELTVSVSQPIDLTQFGDVDLWMQVNITPSPLGKLRSFLAQPPEVYLAVWGKQGPVTGFRSPVPMLSAGFLASPFAFANADVLNLYHGQVARPSAWSVEIAPDTRQFWQNKITCRIFKVENKLGRNVTAEQPQL